MAMSRKEYNESWSAAVEERLKESGYEPSDAVKQMEAYYRSRENWLDEQRKTTAPAMQARIANDRFTSLLDRANKSYAITNSALHRPGEKRRSAKDYAAHITSALNEQEEPETETAVTGPKRGAANRPGNLTSKQINERRAGIVPTETEEETEEKKPEEKKDSLSQVQRDAQAFLDELDALDIDDDLRDELRAALTGLVSDIDTGRNELKSIATSLLDANGTPEYADRYNTRVRDAVAEKTADISLESSIAQLDKEIAEKNRAIKAAEAATAAAKSSSGDSVSENFSLSHIQALRNENQLKEEKKELEERRERLNSQRLLALGESTWQPEWDKLDFNARADYLINLNNQFLEAKKNGDVQKQKALQDELDWYATFGGDDAAVLLRQITYENNLAEIERLDAAIASLVDARAAKMASGNVVAGEYAGEDVSLLDTRIRDLEYLKGQLEQANRQYEITDAVNDANYALKYNADFGEVSSWRNFTNPDEDELYAYGQAKSLSDKEIGEILTNGGDYDPDGNLRDATGKIVSVATPDAPIVTDKLGLFLNARDKDGNMRLNPHKLEEAQEIVNNGLEQNIWADFMVESDAKSWSELTEDEIATYYYLYHTEGKASAYAYLDALTPLLNKRETDREMNRIYEAKGWARLGYNLASIPQNILGGVTAFVEDAVNSASGRDINPYSRLHLAQTLAQATRSTTGEIIDNFAAGNPLTRDELTQLWKGEYAGEIPDDLRNTILGISLGDAYQAGMSGIDSLFGGVLLGPTAYGALMGMGAASMTAKNYYEKGASRDQIIGISLIAGAAEMLFEKWSVEKLLSRKASDGFLKNFLMQGLAEGSEEVNTELANIITDALAMGTQSDWEAAIRAYEAEGNTRAKASALALTDIVGRLWKAGAAGFLSGGMSSGVFTIAQQLQNGKDDQNLLLGLACAHANPAPAMTTAGEIATAINRQRADIAARQAKGEEISAGEYAALDAKKADLTGALAKLSKDEKARAEELVRAYKKDMSVQQKRDVWLGRAVERGVTDNLSTADIDAAIAAAEEAVAAVAAEPVVPTIDEAIAGPTAPAHTEAIASALEAAAKGDTALTASFLDKIIADPAAMAELKIDANLVASGRSKADQRKAVKAAVKDLYQREQTSAVESAPQATQEAPTTAEDEKARRAALIEGIRSIPKFADASEETLNEYLDSQEAMAATEGRTVRVQTGNGAQWVNFAQFYQAAKSRNRNLSAAELHQRFEDIYDTQEEAREKYGGTEVEQAMQSRAGRFVYSTADKDFIDYATFRLMLQERGEELTEAQIAATFDAQYAADQKTPGRSNEARKRQLENSVKALNRNKVLKDSKIEVSVVFGGDTFVKVDGQTTKASFTDIVGADGKTIGKKIVFNGNAISSRDALVRTLVHEIVHPAKKSAGAQGEAMLKAIVQTAERLVDKGQLSRRVAQKVKFREQELKKLSEMYTAQEKKTKGDKAKPEEWTWDSANVFEEYAADLLRDILYETKTAKAIFSAKPSAAHTLLGHAIGIRSKMGKISAEEQELAAELDNIIKIVRAALDGKVADLEKQLDETTDTEETTGEVKHSIESMFDAGGMVAIRDTDSGKISFFLKEDMSPVDKVTVDHIKYKSGIGLLIDTAATRGFITKADAQEQYEAAAELFNMIIETQDPAMIWEFAGAALFSAVKTNADGQYGTTIDFTTVCRKTQDMITAMSKAMMDLGRGLTKDEVTQLQKKLLANDAQVPCPVCYVFSRWAGVGAVLDKMNYWQNKYESATKEELQARIKQLEGLTKKADLRKQLMEDDSLYQDLSAEQEKLKQEKSKLGKELTAAKKRKNQDADTQRIQKENPAQIAALDAKLAAIKKQMKDIEDRGSAELAWLLRVRTADNYAAVPTDVLFNLDSGKEFASQYPAAWAYRTSRGPGVGKAILPYSDMRLGDGIIGPKAADEKADGTQKRDLFKDAAGKWTGDQQKAIDRAIIRTAAQNLIGGQRFQSTSDFRYDYALDYLQAFWEMQALGSNMQTYTKVIEFVDMVAAIGGDVNMSVMPKNAGYADGKLIFSNVTGMNIEAARRANALYDNAQMILVGINDQHIRLALEDSMETGGNEIGFVIPYHASGASIENFISQLVANLNEQFVKDNYTDYSDVQTDHSRKGATEEQARRGDIRKAILTGRVGNEAWTPSADDFLLMQGKSVDISGRSFDELRDIEKRALAGEQAAIDEYLSWSAGILQDLYNRFDGSKVHLKSTQAASIMPHEYWDKSTTRSNAYVNGFIFRSYCYSLGMTPRFTGIAKGGKVVDHGDFSDSTGYWKTLIDRPMYRNDGTYRDQQRINVTKFDAGMLTPAWAEDRWGDYKLAEPSKTKATAAAEQFVSEVKYSLEVQYTNGTSEIVSPYDVTDAAALNYLRLARQGKIKTNAYFPVAPRTPGTVLASLRAKGIPVPDRPLIMQTRKAAQSQREGKPYTVNGATIRPHAVPAETMLEVLARCDSPNNIVQETNRVKRVEKDGDEYYIPAPDRFAVFTDLDDGNEYVAIFEFNSSVDKAYLVADDVVDEYHTTVTIFRPDVVYEGEPYDYASVLLLKPEDNFEIEVTKESPITETATSEILTTASEKGLSSDSNDTTDSGVVKKNSIESDSLGRTLTEGQREYFGGSSVLDDSGNLLALYHGGTVQYEFDTARNGRKGSEYGPGAYFTEDQIAAKDHALFSAGKVQEYYLNAEDMFDDTDMAKTRNSPSWERLNQLLREQGVPENILTRFGNLESNGFTFMRGYLARRAGVRTDGWDGAAEFNALVREAGFDGIKGGYSRGAHQFIIFSPEQAKLTSNENPTTRTDTRHSIESDYVPYDQKAVLKESTVDQWLTDYAAKSSPNYAQAYIAYIRPWQFLKLTTSTVGRISVEEESTPLDKERFGEATRQVPLQLTIDSTTGEVLGHEGRHRAVALGNAGILEVPVLLFDSGNKYTKQPISEITLSGQDFGGTRSYDRAMVRDLLPMSFANRDEVIRRFATPSRHQQIGERYGFSQTLRYSIESETDDITNTPSLDDLFGPAREAFAAAEEEAAANPVTAADIGSIAQTGDPVGMVIYGSTAFDPQAAAELDRVYAELVEKFGPMKPKSTAVRNEPAPRRTAPGNKVMQTTTTVLGAQATPESRVADIKRMVVDQKVSYVPNTNVASIQKARGRISRMTYQGALVDWTARVRRGEANGDLVTLGAVLLNNAGNSVASGEEYVSILTDYAQLLHNAGEALQAAKVLQKLTPEGKLYSVQKAVDKINEENEKRKTRKGGKRSARNADSDIDAKHNPGLPVDQWMDKVGEQLAGSIKSRVDTTDAKARTVSQTILSDLKKFAQETLPQQSKKMAKRSEIDRIRDLFENRENYDKAWAAAKRTMREQFGAKKETMDAINEWLKQSREYADMLSTLAQQDGGEFEAAALDQSLVLEYMWAEDERREEIYDQIRRSGSHTRTELSAIRDWLAEAARQAETLAEQTPEVKSLQIEPGLLTEYLRAQTDEQRERVLDQISQDNADNPDAMAAINDWLNQSLDYAAMLTREVTDVEGVKIKPEYAEAYLRAENDTQRDAMLQLIYKDLASQMKATGLEMFTALRYLGMLGNLRTQVRNLVGNAAFQPVRMVSESVQGIMEAMLQKVGVDIERTTSVLLDRETLAVAKEEYAKVRDAILAGGKYQETSGLGDNAREAIEKHRRIFVARIGGEKVDGQRVGGVNVLAPLEWARRGTNWAMDTGDSIFCSLTFGDALARYIKANRTTWSKASDALKDKAIAYAIREAAEATYRDTNQFSKMISSLGRAKNDSSAERLKATIFTGILPFRKTPANILVRAIEYSPIGLLDTAVRKSIQAARGKGEVTGTDIVRGLSKGLTGSALVALGFALAAGGKLRLRGKLPEEEEERRYMEMLGYQAYSLEIGDKSYTLDWLAPECIPMFLGANLHDVALSEGLTVDEVTQAFASLSDPLLSMSMLQGVNDALEDTASYGTDQALFRFTVNSLWSYMTQPVGTLLGQVKRSMNNTRMTTYVDKNKEMPDYAQRMIGKLAAKIPFWNYAQVAYTDAWGRMEQNAQSATWNVIQQIVSPGYSSTIEATPMEEELLRLYRATGDSSVLIKTPDKYFTLNGERKDLTAEEYTTYNMTRGQTAFNLMTELVSSVAYQSLDDAAKAKAVSNIYAFATQSAKFELTHGAYTPDKWVLNSIDAAYDVGLPVNSVALYKTLLSTLNAEYPDGITVAGELMDVNAYVREQMYRDNTLGNTQKEALDNILISDGQYIPKDLEVDYSNGWDAFKMSQQSDSANTKFTNLPSHFDLDSAEFTAAYKICNNDELSSLEKKEELEAIAGSADAADDLYSYITRDTVTAAKLPEDLPEAVSEEILRLATCDVGYQYSIGYYDSAPTSYTDPDSKVDGKATKEWRLTSEQQEEYKSMRQDLYTSKMTSLLNSGRYQSASDAKKCEMIEELKSEVTDEVKEDFIAWLRIHGTLTARK